MSLPDTIIIILLGLVLFGPRKLPEIARQIGKILGELKRASNEFKFQMDEELRQAELVDRRKQQAVMTPLAAPLPQPPAPQPPAGAPVVANRVSARAASDEGAMSGILAPDGFVTDPQPPVDANTTSDAESASQTEPIETAQNA